MASAAAMLAVYCLAIAAASLLGGLLPGWVRMTHTRIQLSMSLVAGLMLGVACFHLIPHAVPLLGEGRALDRAMLWTMAGLVTMFILLRAFHFHQHDYPLPVEGFSDLLDAAPGSAPDTLLPGAHAHGEGHHHHAGHPHAHSHASATSDMALSPHRLSWLGVALGLGVHTLIDGVALGAVVLGEAAAGVSGALGVGVFVAILLHKPLDAMSITGVMRASGWKSRPRLLANIGFALLCPLGALAFYFGADYFPAERDVVVGSALAFSAGTFICIALSDLLPEVHFHSHDRLKLTAAFLLGISLAYGIGVLESPLSHGHVLY
jgi:zinc and cadmium transporter